MSALMRLPIPSDLAVAVAQTTALYQQAPGPVLVSAAAPHEFLSFAIAALQSHCPVFLANPHWQSHEWQQVQALIRPTWHNDQAAGNSVTASSTLANLTISPAPIMIPTGGSSGQIRFAVHTQATLAAAVAGIQAHFGVTAIHSFCVLPLFHVSGWLQVMRSGLSGGRLVLPQGDWRDYNPAGFWLSLVPTQLHRLLGDPDWIAWLRRFELIFIGGAPASAALLDTAQAAQLPLVLCYGATETAAMITAQRPGQFLDGDRSCGPVLPHANVQFDAAGQIEINAQSLMLGYYPQIETDRTWCSRDRGYLDTQGNLHLQGRDVPSINSGGEKIDPNEVETLLRQSGLVEEVVVLGLPDREWGEVVTAIYTPATIDPARLKAWLQSRLSAYKLPKHWYGRATLPRNGQGKLLRQELWRELCEPLDEPRR
ncbi:MAG: AMP-binding protein [Synechococcaceae cyanobacterium SM2_3_60]|nr:AMP-binding protein [Synechococcaceae cyanobacterium SM2_3_60]